MMLLSADPKLNRSMSSLPCVLLVLIGTPLIEQRDAAGPAGRGSLDLHREAADLETERRQLVEIGELLHVAITDLAAGLVSFPDEACVAGFREPFAGERKRCVPAPAVGAGHTHTLSGQV